jgi:hypothetical protein
LKVVLKRKDEEKFRKNHPQESLRLIEGFGLP